MPQFSELSAKGEKNRGYSVVLKIKKAILRIIGPIALILGITSPFWLKILYGDIYAKNWYILLFYLLVQTYALSYTTIHSYFLSLNKSKQSALYCCIANVVYMILAILLVKTWGMFGIVFSYLIQVLIVIKLKERDIKKEQIYE